MEGDADERDNDVKPLRYKKTIFHTLIKKNANTPPPSLPDKRKNSGDIPAKSVTDVSDVCMAIHLLCIVIRPACVLWIHNIQEADNREYSSRCVDIVAVRMLCS